MASLVERANGFPPQTHKTEEEELDELHAEAVLRFRLEKPSPESEDDETHDAEDPTVEEEPVDPDLGIYDPDTGGVRCKVCDAPLNSKGQFRDHLKGQKHKKKYERKQRLKAQEEAEAAPASLALPSLVTGRTTTRTGHPWGAYVPTASR